MFNLEEDDVDFFVFCCFNKINIEHYDGYVTASCCGHSNTQYFDKEFQRTNAAKYAVINVYKEMNNEKES